MVGRLELGKAFEDALKHLIENDAKLFTWLKAKIGIAHTFAYNRHKTLCKVLGLSSKSYLTPSCTRKSTS